MCSLIFHRRNNCKKNFTPKKTEFPSKNQQPEFPSNTQKSEFPLKNQHREFPPKNQQPEMDLTEINSISKQVASDKSPDTRTNDLKPLMKVKPSVMQKPTVPAKPQMRPRPPNFPLKPQKLRRLQILENALIWKHTKDHQLIRKRLAFKNPFRTITEKQLLCPSLRGLPYDYKTWKGFTRFKQWIEGRRKVWFCWHHARWTEDQTRGSNPTSPADDHS